MYTYTFFTDFTIYEQCLVFMMNAHFKKCHSLSRVKISRICIYKTKFKKKLRNN